MPAHTKAKRRGRKAKKPKKPPEPLRPLKVKAKEKAGRITTAGRRALKGEDYALPDGPAGQAGKFPIPDRAHAINALARAPISLKKGNITPAQYATIRRRVRAKFPGIDVTEPRQRRRARRTA